MDQQQLETLLVWVDSVPLSRPRRNIHRDFSDGVLIAELISQYRPRLVELHNYCPASSAQHKRQNWLTLQRKVLDKLGVVLSGRQVNQLVGAQPGAVECVLTQLKNKLVAEHNDKEQQLKNRSDRDGSMEKQTQRDDRNHIKHRSPVLDPPHEPDLSSTQTLQDITRSHSDTTSKLHITQSHSDSEHTASAEIKRLKHLLSYQSEEIGVLNARVSRLETILQLNQS